MRAVQERVAFRRNSGRHPVPRRHVRGRGGRLAGVLLRGRRDSDDHPRPTRHPDAARAAAASVITPRTTRLVRSADLRSFRGALVTLCTTGSPLDARDRLVIVPTRAASLHLVRTIEDSIPEQGAVLLPDFVTRSELHERLFERIQDSAGSAPNAGHPQRAPY